MTTPDDSALFHAQTYDPAKARAYYLRTRKLKGRTKGSQDNLSGQDNLGSSTPSNSGSSNSKMRPSRQAELRAQRDALVKRLDRLKSLLATKVDQAKSRSGVSTQSTKESKDPKETAAKNEADKKAKPLTAKQKSDKRVTSKEQYEEEKDMSLSVEVQQLQKQIADIRSKIQRAVADSRRKSSQTKSKTALERPLTLSTERR